MAGRRRPAQGHPHPGHPADVERHPHQRRRPIPTTTRTAPTPITCISTRAASTRSSTPRRGRSSGRPTPSAATATPIRCSTNYLNRLGIEKLKLDYLSYPQRALWDKIGVRTMVMETDPFGNFLTQGYEYMSGRDWARLGNLYLNDGVTPGGERILPEGYTDFVSTLAPAWVADERPVYGGFFWINGDGAWPIPKEAYSMNGAGGQAVWIDPVARSRGRAHRQLQGLAAGAAHAEQGARDPDDGGTQALRRGSGLGARAREARTRCTKRGRWHDCCRPRSRASPDWLAARCDDSLGSRRARGARRSSPCRRRRRRPAIC